MKPLLPDAALVQHLIALGKTGSGKSSALRVLVERLLDQDKPVAIIDPKGDWWGLKSSADGRRAGYPVVIFGGEHADVPLNAHAGAHVAELVATGNRPCIIDLGGWMVGDRTRFFIDFASTLFRHTRGPRWLVIDEVHNFAPQGKVIDPDAGKMLHWANRLASEGRGKGVTLLAASQRPQKVHKDFLTSCETLLAMRVIHPLDRGAIKDWIDGCPDAAKGREVLGSLAQMPRGESWAWSPEIGFGPQRIAFPKFKTYDSFAAPVGETAAKLAGWATVDLEEVRAKLADVVQEAEANDPKRLRAEIARLKALVHSAGTGGATKAELDAEYGRGRVDGFESGRLKGREEVLRNMPAAIASIKGAISGLQAAQEQLMSPLPAIQAASHSHPIRDTARRAGTAERAPEAATGSGSTALPKAERLVLTALAQYPQGRSKTQIAILTGYSVNGGGFNNALGALRSTRRIVGPPERITITQYGLEALGPFDPLPRGRELLEHWYRQLGKAERKALEALVEVYPRTLSKTQCAARAGYEPDGGGFNNALGKLRSLELISGRGEIRASEDLFDG